MPRVGGKHYPYTKAGVKAARMARKAKKKNKYSAALAGV